MSHSYESNAEKEGLIPIIHILGVTLAPQMTLYRHLGYFPKIMA